MSVSQLKNIFFLSWSIWCADARLVSRCAAVSFIVTRRFSIKMASSAAKACVCHYWVCLTGSTWFCYRSDCVYELPSALVHLLWWQTRITILSGHSSMNFDVFHPFNTQKTDDRTLLFVACCKGGRHFYNPTAPSCWIPASYCRLSATLQTVIVIVVNLQHNRAVFRIFITLLRISLDSYLHDVLQDHFVVRRFERYVGTLYACAYIVRPRIAPQVVHRSLRRM
jgi:hypothetical protein